MTNRDLLKEAIADAKAIKETAIANAKAALEESFTPHLMSRLAAKINEMDQHFEEDDTLEEINTDLDEMKEKEDIEEAGAEIEEIDLDELLAELDSTDDITEGEDKEEVDEAKKDEEKEEEGEDEEIDLENMSEEDLKNFIESVIEDMISGGEIEAGEKMEDEAGDEEMGDEEMEADEEEINIDEILAELKSGDDVEEGMSQEMGSSAGAGLAELAKMFKAGMISLNDFLEKLASATAPGFSKGLSEEEETKKELEEAMKAIKTLRSEMNEVNLLNAKLLYTNKIFKAKNLTESEKVRVLTAFDKAASKNEAKLVYETLIESLNNKKKAPIKENLGRASKPAGMAPIRKPIVESNDMVARFQKLAGII
jgi:hypothetical protein